MTELFNGISYIISETFKLLGTVTTSLLSNEIFQITLGMVFLAIVIGLIFYMISKTNKTKMSRYRKIVSKNYIGSENWTNKQVRECARLNNYWK